MQKYSWIIAIILILVIGLGFGYLYFDDHAYGAWGDDSPGYLYLAGRMLQGEPLVYQDELVQKGLDHFGDEKLARFLTPTHHEIISPDGWLASIYPVGLSVVMFSVAKLSGNDLAIYFVVPALAALNLVLIFLICDLLFKMLGQKKWSWVFAFFAAVTVGLSGLYYDYAISQPMREIPSLFFILLAAYLFLLSIKYHHEGATTSSRLQLALMVLGTLSLGFSLNIRHTGIAVLPAFIVLLFYICNTKKFTIKQNSKKTLSIGIVFIILLIIPLIFTIYNSYQISEHKEKFRNKDISGTAIVSNIDHVGSLSPLNMISSEGKFRTENGGLDQYWQVMKNMSWLPYFMILVFIGVYYTWRKNKYLSAFLSLWVLGFLALFSMWVNPYSRYIIVAFPALAILGSFGLYYLLTDIYPKLVKNVKIGKLLAILTILSILFIYSPAVALIQENLEEEVLINKAISESDLNNLLAMGKLVEDRGDEKPIIMFSGNWQYGLSETLETHTGIKTIRMPFEQQKFEFNNDQVKAFFDQLLDDGYTIYFWQDSGTSGDTNDFLWENYQLNELKKYSFSFTDEIILYELHK